MDIKNQIFKSGSRFGKIPSCVVDISYFKKLYDILKEISDDAIDFELSKLDKNNFNSLIDFEKAKDNLREVLRINVHIIGTKGESIVSHEKSIFDEQGLPNHISRISFDNTNLMRYVYNINPSNSFRIEFDFSKQSIFDFVSNPSLETSNSSNITIIGQKNSWVHGAYESVISTLEEFTTNRSWLHKKNIYDLFLWLLIIPISFWNLYKFESYFKHIFNDLPIVFGVFLHLYFLIFILYSFMIFFKYTRWLFPYTELKESLNNSSTTHRSFWFIILLTIVADIIVLIIKTCF